MKTGTSIVIKSGIIILLITLVTACGPSLREQLLEENPEWQDKYVKMIKNGNITEGMTKDMVMAAWGKPQRNSEVTEASYSRQWVYETASTDSYKSVFVFFKNGKVVKIQ